MDFSPAIRLPLLDHALPTGRRPQSLLILRPRASDCGRWHRPLIDPAPASERIDSGETADGQYPKRYPTTLNKNPSQPAVATRTTIQNTIGTQALRMRNEYRGAVKPQRNPRLNLTDQPYWRPTVRCRSIPMRASIPHCPPGKRGDAELP
jgi:hypothetical protein